ncbi:MAG: hypothetical protein ACFB12_02340, partial [Leptolyngbyaceae cyanobacterium]
GQGRNGGTCSSKCKGFDSFLPFILHFASPFLAQTLAASEIYTFSASPPGIQEKGASELMQEVYFLVPSSVELAGKAAQLN